MGKKNVFLCVKGPLHFSIKSTILTNTSHMTWVSNRVVSLDLNEQIQNISGSNWQLISMVNLMRCRIPNETSLYPCVRDYLDWVNLHMEIMLNREQHPIGLNPTLPLLPLTVNITWPASLGHPQTVNQANPSSLKLLLLGYFITATGKSS